MVTLMCFSQKEVKKKETVYLFFNLQSNEKCKVAVRAKGYVDMNKFRKDYRDNGNIINFKICDERFAAHKNRSYRDTCSIKALDNIKFVDFDYLIEKYNSVFEFKHHVFEKIYFVEKISDEKIIKYEVRWLDERIMFRED